MPFWLIPVFPPTEASTIESKVVGILTKSIPLLKVFAENPPMSVMTPPQGLSINFSCQHSY